MSEYCIKCDMKEVDPKSAKYDDRGDGPYCDDCDLPVRCHCGIRINEEGCPGCYNDIPKDHPRVKERRSFAKRQIETECDHNFRFAGWDEWECVKCSMRVHDSDYKRYLAVKNEERVEELEAQNKELLEWLEEQKDVANKEEERFGASSYEDSNYWHGEECAYIEVIEKMKGVNK